jgi:hypothetical protein
VAFYRVAYEDIKVQRLYMSAKLNLLPRKKFEIVLEDGTVIEGQSGMWAINRLTKGKRSETDTDMDAAAAWALAAVEQTYREKGGVNFPYTDVHAFAWFDQLEQGDIALLFEHFQDEEKKTVNGASSTGIESSETQPAQVS